jgi:hypothetical protein
MTREEQLKCIADRCDAFKQAMLSKASKIPKNWEDAEIRQWVIDAARDAPVIGRMDAARMRRYQVARQLYGL